MPAFQEDDDIWLQLSGIQVTGDSLSTQSVNFVLEQIS